jgi:hypothetical protein
VSGPATRRIVLHVDRLVLRGIDRADAAGVAEGLQAELQALLAGEGAVAALASQHALHAVRAGTARLSQDADGAAVGRAVAGRIVQGSKPCMR